MTEADEMAIPCSWNEFMVKSFNLLDGYGMITLVFDNYWKQLKKDEKVLVDFESNGSNMGKCARSLVDSGQRLLNMLKGLVEKENEVVLSSLEKALISTKNIAAPLGVDKAAISSMTAVMFQMMRAVSHNSAYKGLMLAFMQPPQPQHRQRGVGWSQFTYRFHGQDWMKCYLHEVTCLAQNHLNVRYLVESAMIGFMRRQPHRDYEYGRESLDWNRDVDEVEFKKWPSNDVFNSKKVSSIRTALGTGHAGGDIESRFYHGFYVSIFTDILRTIGIWGFDPDFRHRPTYTRVRRGKIRGLTTSATATKDYDAAAKVRSDKMEKIRLAIIDKRLRAGWVAEDKDDSDCNWFVLAHDDDDDDDEDEDVPRGRRKKRRYNIYLEIQKEYEKLPLSEDEKKYYNMSLRNVLVREYLSLL